MNRIHAVMLAAALFAGPICHASANVVLADCPVGAPSTNVAHTQALLDTETLLVCPYDAGTGGHPFVTRTYVVTNDTGTAWTDYHFGLSLDLPAGVAPPQDFGFDLPTLNPAIGSVSLDDDLHISVFFAQALATGGDFSISLRFGDYTQGTAIVTGTPSVPEPGTLSLLALGLSGLVWGRRRRS